MSNQTSKQYHEVISTCRTIFEKKNQDYGPSWRLMRILSIVDQIYIKAARIRTIEEKGVSKIEEGVTSELMGIINYCVMGLIQLNVNYNKPNPNTEILLQWYDEQIKITYDLMTQKNHDYGEIWRDMEISTFTDMQLMRVQRMKQILNNKGETIMSEGVESNLMDMINYAAFALIKIGEQKVNL